MYKLSPSNLQILKDCPRCFWLHHNKNIKRPESAFPSLPSGIDKALKNYFDSFIKKDELPKELQELEGVKLFDDLEKLKEWRNAFKGIRWTDKKGNLLHGAIDNLLVKDNKLIVIDYKTRGYPLKEDTPDYYQDQIDIYNLLLRKNNYPTEEYSYLIFYHPERFESEGRAVFNIDLVKVEVSIENAEQIFERAIKVLEGEMPDYSEECVYCKWAEKLK